MMRIEIAEDRLDLIYDLMERYRCALLAPVPLKLSRIRRKLRAAVRSITAQITYCYAFADSTASDTTLRTLGTLLPAVLTYLYHACGVGEQTFGNVLRLLCLPPDTLGEMLLERPCDPRYARRAYHRAQAYLVYDSSLFNSKSLETAMLLFLQQQNLLPDEWALRRRAQLVLRIA